MTKQVLKVQKDAIARYKRIADLWVAYYVHGEDPSEFGREFYQAVGDLLEGNPISNLLLHHIEIEDVQNVVFTGRSASGDGVSETEAKEGRAIEQQRSTVDRKSESRDQKSRTDPNREKRESRGRSTATTRKRR